MTTSEALFNLAQAKGHLVAARYALEKLLFGKKIVEIKERHDD